MIHSCAMVPLFLLVSSAVGGRAKRETYIGAMLYFCAKWTLLVPARRPLPSPPNSSLAAMRPRMMMSCAS